MQRRSMSGRRRWSAAIGIALAVGLASPAVAKETTFDDTCADVYGERPIGDLEKSTDPVAGSSVVGGHRVTVTVTWPTFAIAGERNHRVMECISVDGGEPQLWAERTFTTAEDTVTLAAVVPAGSRQTVCSQSFLKTEGSFGPVTRWSEKTCFPVGESGTFTALARSPSPPSASAPREPQSRSTPTTRERLFSPKRPSSRSSPSPPGRSGDYQAPWPPWEEAPRVASTLPVPSTTTTAPRAAASTPRQQEGRQAAAPAASASTQAPSQTLPKTGAGVVVLMGAAAVALFSGRTLRKTALHIEENMPVEALPVDDGEEPTLILGRRW